MLDARRLRLLYDLSMLGTIAAVADVHAYTPSAVSQQLSVLEREAGLPLLERSGRRVALTPAGRVLVRHAENVLAEMERTQAALAAMVDGLTGPLRIGAFPTAVHALFPSALVALGGRHPGLELMVTELDPVKVPAALREHVLDVGLLQHYDVVPAQPHPGLETAPLLDETVFLAVPASTTLDDAPAHSGLEALDAVRDAPWILAGAGTLCHAATLHVCHAAGFEPRPRHHADDFATVLALVGAGHGVSLVPELAASQAPPGVRLLPLPTRRRTRIACRRGGSEHPAISAFIDAMREAVRAFTERADAVAVRATAEAVPHQGPKMRPATPSPEGASPAPAARPAPAALPTAH
jgi:DNA-binding transcriptional LysR family regulator